MPLPKYRLKLLKLFNSIDDESIKTIISEVVSLENENRSSANFPIRKVEAIVDGEANLLEAIKRKEIQNEI